jgi:diaminopimelate dehydrogenase
MEALYRRRSGCLKPVVSRSSDGCWNLPGLVIDAIRADPLFLGDETLVFPVASIAALEQEGRGVLLERRGATGRLWHQQFLLEARFDESQRTAHMMLAAACALPQLTPSAHSILDLRLSALWGEQQGKAEGQWL